MSPIVNVQIVRISISKLKSQFQCYNGRLIALLPTMSLTNIIFRLNELNALFYTLGFTINEIVHGIFAIKYWVISKKIK